MPKFFLLNPNYLFSHIFIFLVTYSAVGMLWKLLCIVSNSPSPVIVVTSESMEPSFRRGDVLFLWNRTEAIEVGDVVACWFKGNDLPMVHRVVEKRPSWRYTSCLARLLYLSLLERARANPTIAVLKPLTYS